jgi:hypothetical protein
MTDDSRFVRRAELVLARPATEPLDHLKLDPDPLHAFARALSGLRDDLGESASVVVDVLPATAAQRRWLRHGLLRQAQQAESGTGSSALMAVLMPARTVGARRPALRPAESVERRSDSRQLANKLLEHEPLFALQILLRTASSVEGRADAHMEALLSCFDAWSGQNWLRVAGINLLGFAFLGADALPWRRGRFDRRFETGLFRPSRTNLVTGREILGFLKPPTKRGRAPNVIGLGGAIPPAPPGLPAFQRQPNLLPLGEVSGQGGERRLVGVPLADTLFAYMAGRSQFGKTETAINQFIHLARSGQGGLFLDPHEDALKRIKAHLTDEGLGERIIEINLAAHGRDQRQLSWNLFSMEGAAPGAAEERVAAVVDSFASVMQWDERNSRAVNLTTQVAQSLIELAQKVPADLAPTIFSVNRLLSDEGWRTEVLRFLSPASREFWEQRFPLLPAEAITPITNLVDRMRASRAIAGLMGSPRGTYDIRRAMDAGRVVLACPGTGGLQQNRLVANLLIYDLLHAALLRPEGRRRVFWAFVDEAQTCDGASNGNLAALLEQCAKFGVRLFLFNQDPERLTARTWSAIKTNRSHLLSTVVSAEAAAMIAKQWGGEPAPGTITRLDRFTYVASLTLGGEILRPFLVRGVPVSEMWSDCHHPERLATLDRLIDRRCRRRPVSEVIAGLDGHDDRILAHLRTRRRAQESARRRSGARPGSGERAYGDKEARHE